MPLVPCMFYKIEIVALLVNWIVVMSGIIPV